MSVNQLIFRHDKGTACFPLKGYIIQTNKYKFQT